MSIWKTTTYKLDIAKLVYEAFPNAANTILGSDISKFLQPTEGLTTLTSSSDWDDVAAECGWSSAGGDEVAEERFVDKYTGIGKWFVGVPAVYQIIRAVSKGRFSTKPAYDYSTIRNTMSELGKLIMPSTQASPIPFMALWESMPNDLLLAGEVYENASEGFKYMRREFRREGEEMEKIQQVRYFGEGSRVYYGHVRGDLCIMRGAEEYVNRGLIFSRSHLNLLIEALMRIANIHYYVATQYAGGGVAAEAILAMLELTIKSASKTKNFNVDKVVQAFHKARMFHQMVLFGNVHEGAILEARNEYREKGLNEILDLDHYLSIVRSAPLAQQLDVAQVYKWMPPPDFDSTYAFGDLKGWHMNTRASGVDDGASMEMQAMWERVANERKMNTAVAYKKMTGSWPAAFGDVNRAPDMEAIIDWDPSNLFPYYTYGTDVVTQVKDKATVSASLTREFEGNASRVEDSFLLWYMENNGAIDSRADAEKLINGVFEEDNYVKVAYKGEAHKPGSRLFFMAPPRRRILLGEMEGNMAKIAEHYPGCLQGKSVHKRAEIMQNLFDIYAQAPGAPADAITTTYIVTFDLSKFSPKSNGNVLRNYHAYWAKVFGAPIVDALFEIGPDSDIIHTTGGLRMRYKNKGADLEGFRGRMMTMFHADMLGAACRLARERGFIVGKSVLAVFIDDGAVRIAANGEDEEARENANRFLECMQEIYAAAGQENHPNKTVVSLTGGELLAEQYLNSQKLKCPIKAAMRLYPDYDNPACSITEEIDALFAASQGSVKDGGTWVPTYWRYAYSVLKTINRWDRQNLSIVTPMKLALKLLTPKSFGGFGIQPMQGLTTTSTLNMTIEGLGLLNRVGRYYPGLRDTVRRIVEKPVVKRDPVQLLRDPTRVRAAGRVLIENRLMMAIIKKIEESSALSSKFMMGYRSEELREQARAVAVAILSSHAVSIPLIQRAWRATTLAYVESVVSKFKRAKTIISLLGYKAVGNIRKKNAEDVTEILSH